MCERELKRVSDYKFYISLFCFSFYAQFVFIFLYFFHHREYGKNLVSLPRKKLWTYHLFIRFDIQFHGCHRWSYFLMEISYIKDQGFQSLQLIFEPTRLSCLWNPPGKNTGVGCHSLLQGILLTQGRYPDLLHCRQILYCLSHQRSPLE